MAAQAVKTHGIDQVRHFLNSCLSQGSAFVPEGRKFEFVGPRTLGRTTQSTLRALAAALVLWAQDEQRTTYEVLRDCSVEARVEEPSPEVMRRYAATLRSEWNDILRASLAEDEMARYLFPSTSTPIRLTVLSGVFDVAKAKTYLYRLQPPQLMVAHRGETRKPISLDVLEPGVWKMVGNARTAEPIGKIAISYDPYLSRSAFEICLESGRLHVRLKSERNKLYHNGQETSEFHVVHGGVFSFGDLSFTFLERNVDHDTATPVHPPRKTSESGDF